MDFFGRGLFQGGANFPPVHLYEKDKQYVLEADIGNLNESDISLRATEKTIIIEGNKPCVEESDRKVIYSERFCGNFRKEIQLPSKIDPDEVTGDFLDGVLMVTARSLSKHNKGSVGIKINTKYS